MCFTRNIKHIRIKFAGSYAQSASSNAVYAHIVEKTVLQIDEEELEAVQDGEGVKTQSHLLGDSGVDNADDDDGKEEDGDNGEEIEVEAVLFVDGPN